MESDLDKMIKNEGLKLVGESVFLRPLAVQDAEGDYSKWFNDEELCMYSQHHKYPMTKDMLVDFINGTSNNDKDLVLAIVQKEGGLHIGNIALQNIDKKNNTTEFAAIVSKRGVEGVNVLLESIELLMEYVFTELKVRRLHGGTISPVITSIMDILGFRREGVKASAVYKNGKYHDIVLYGMLKKEYDER